MVVGSYPRPVNMDVSLTGSPLLDAIGRKDLAISSAWIDAHVGIYFRLFNEPLARSGKQSHKGRHSQITLVPL